MSVDSVPVKAPDDSFITQAKDGLICIQWYEPLFDRLFPSPDDTNQHVIMFYALVCKSHKKQNGTRWIDLSELRHIVNV